MGFCYAGGAANSLGIIHLKIPREFESRTRGGAAPLVAALRRCTTFASGKRAVRVNGREGLPKETQVGRAGRGKGERDIFDFEASIRSLFFAVRVPLVVIVFDGRDASQGSVVHVALLFNSFKDFKERVTAFSALDALWGFAFCDGVFTLIVVPVKNFALQVHLHRAVFSTHCGRELLHLDMRTRVAPIRICSD